MSQPPIDPGQSLGPQQLYDHDDPQAALRRAQERQRQAEENAGNLALARARQLEAATRHNTRRCDCGALVIWTVTAKGKKMMVDFTPVTDATPRFELQAVGSRQVNAVFVDRQGQIDKRPGHVAHFATCPNAAKHRKP
jgi:hypothetical protein